MSLDDDDDRRPRILPIIAAHVFRDCNHYFPIQLQMAVMLMDFLLDCDEPGCQHELGEHNEVGYYLKCSCGSRFLALWQSCGINMLRELWFALSKGKQQRLMRDELPRLFFLGIVFEDAKVLNSLPPITRRRQFYTFHVLYLDCELFSRHFYFSRVEKLFMLEMKRMEHQELLAQLHEIVAALQPLHLPTYVLLWICDWLPAFDEVKQYDKVATIERVRLRCAAIVAARPQV